MRVGTARDRIREVYYLNLTLRHQFKFFSGVTRVTLFMYGTRGKTSWLLPLSPVAIS